MQVVVVTAPNGGSVEFQVQNETQAAQVEAVAALQGCKAEVKK